MLFCHLGKQRLELKNTVNLNNSISQNYLFFSFISDLSVVAVLLNTKISALLFV